MFLSDTESDSDDDDDEDSIAPPPRSKIPVRAEFQKRPLSFNGPPPPYTVHRNDGPGVLSMSSKARRDMQNL